MDIKIIFVLFSHYVLDYPLQGDFLSNSKGKNMYSLFAHSMIYSLGMSICLYILDKFQLYDVFILLVSHMIIDYIKANSKNEKYKHTVYLYIDQALHIIINMMILFF